MSMQVALPSQGSSKAPRAQRFTAWCGALALSLCACKSEPKSEAPAATTAAATPAPAAKVAAVTINVTDVGGALTLLQDAIEGFRTKNPAVVEKFNFTKAPAPELPGKLKAMQEAGRSDIDLAPSVSSMRGLPTQGRRAPS